MGKPPDRAAAAQALFLAHGADLPYGSGLRLTELLRLRIKDADLDRLRVTVRAGKGDKDRSPRSERTRAVKIEYPPRGYPPGQP